MDTKIILTDEERHYLEYIGHHNIDDLIDGVGIGDTPLIMRDDLQYYREHRAQEDEWLHEHEAMEARAKAKAKEWEDQTAYIYALPEDERWDALMSEATNAMDRAEQVGINHLSDVE